MKKILTIAVFLLLSVFTLSGCHEEEPPMPEKNAEFIEKHADIPLPEGLTITESNWGNTIDQFNFVYLYPNKKFKEEIQKSITSEGWTFVIENKNRLFFTKENFQIIVMITETTPVKGVLTIEPLGTEEIPQS